MKNLGLVVLSAILSVSASPLGDRVVFRRHSSVPVSRRYVLQSRTTAPPACVAAVPSGSVSAPDPSATDIPVADPTASDNSTDPTTALPSNTTTTDPTLAGNTTVADPTATDNSTAAANTTATRRSTRFWARDHHFSDFGGFDSSDVDVFSEHDSVSVSFEEEASTFVSTWETLCLNSGGDIFTDDPCTNLAGFNGIDALLETAGSCDQQFIADSMITFAKSKGIRNSDDLINFALSYRRHARNAVKILDIIPSSLYCLEEPVNVELHGVYNEQLEGCDPGLFGSPTVSMVPFGSDGTCPFGMSADVDTCGCVSSDGTTDSTDGTDDTTDGTDDTTDSTDSTDSSADSTDSTDSTDATDSTDSTDSTDATSTDSADATSTDTPSTADVTDAATDSSAPAATATFSTGVNVQPTDISGDVNDPNGRR
ncbi:hypothetical protein BDN70DRAFT_896432 [Pholiota conissans]|uniref:Uncharacterized protein n=1 Tax=Pholiota conissans TaxID=109636 RepID=A0A9P5Z147_9AGAR|nr:hypothetical protein BDN70DRAFT_896432 [Pholiota conissans]